MSFAAATVVAIAVLPGVASAQIPTEPLGHHPCVQGQAGPFRCHQIDLMSFLPSDSIGGGPGSQYGGPGNDVWGWTDPVTNREWVVMGRSDGTSFIDISDPKRPVFVANLPRHGRIELHSDIKMYENHAFIVKDGRDNGMQVFDLTRLRDIDYDDAPVTVDADAVYEGISNAHNLHINEDTGFAYVVGATRDVAGVPACHAGGLHIVDIRDPRNPTFAGCFDEDGYTHDVQCVIYRGPDVRYQGREICFASNPDPPLPGRLTVVDVTDKSNPVLLSRTPQGAPYAYSHQGWLTEDHRYFLHDDESDEITNPGRTRTRIFDVSDLENVFVQSVYHGETHAADHNLYVKGRYAYLTNYFDGLRVVNITKIDHPGTAFAPDTPALIDHQGLWEAACFDTDPVRNDIPGFGGVWSNYPWFKNGVVAVSGFEGLWLVRTRLGSNAAFPSALTKAPPTGKRGGREDNCL
jgi:choice-of-anchor B domain-containing protein